MRTMLLGLGAAALAIAGPAIGQGQGQGKGNDKDRGQPAAAGKAKDSPKGNAQRADNGNRASNGNKAGGSPAGVRAMRDQSERPANANAGRNNSASGNSDRASSDRGNSANRGAPSAADLRDRAAIAWRDNDERFRDDFREWRRPDGNIVRTVRFGDNGRFFRGDTGLIGGCPPGLAKKNNGCLPPGQAKKRFGVDRVRSFPGYRDTADYFWRYDDGYLYRINRGDNIVSAFLPLLGGALGVGNTWPNAYAGYAVPSYYERYYGLNDDYRYRYGNGAIFALDPETRAIQSVAALLTGDDWAVGQRMPTGYDAYNVPFDYRDRYYDRPDAMYRYSDGYVYQVDPETRLVAAVIELLV